MKTRLVMLLVLVGVFLMPQVATARPLKCHLVRTTVMVRDTVVVRTKRVCGVVAGATGIVSTTDPTAADAACTGAAAALHVAPEKACSVPHHKKPGQPGPAQIAAAVWRLQLPPSALHIQPVKGRTLVNLATNFYATNHPIERTVNLLGHGIRVRVWASRYAWTFGDGASRRTTTPGAPYPELLVTHRYLRKGVVHPSLSTTYVAEYRLGGGTWRPVAGSADIVSPAQRLEVVTATPRLTDPYD